MKKSESSLPVGTKFAYQNQMYIVERNSDTLSIWRRFLKSIPCIKCEEVNAQYIKDNPYKCVAMTKTGTYKFSCRDICGPLSYPKRIK